MAKVAAGVATVALTGIAALPYALRALVRKHTPTATGPHTVGSCVQRDSSGLLVRVFYPLGACVDEPDSSWLPAPQSVYITAIGAFLNLPSAIAGWLLAPGLRAVRGAWVEQAQPGELPAGDEQGQRDREIESGPLLASIRWCQIHDDANEGPAKAAVAKCCPNAFARFLDCGIWKPHKLKAGKPWGQIHFHRDGERLHALKGCAGAACQHWMVAG